jgi:hypothetical protein
MSSRLAAPFVRPLLPVDPQDHDHDYAHNQYQPWSSGHGQPAYSQPPHAATHHTHPGHGHGHGSEASSPEIYWRQPPQPAGAGADTDADAGPPRDLLHVLERVRALRYAAAEPFLGTPVWRRPCLHTQVLHGL